MPNTNEPITLDQVLADARRLGQRARAAKALETKNEVGGNIYPLIEALVEAVNVRLYAVEATVTALIQETDSIIQPELADQIIATLDFGIAVCNEVEPILASFDDVTRKRIADAISAFRQAQEITTTAVDEVTIEDGEEDDDDEDDEDTAEGAEEDPAEAPSNDQEPA